MNEQVTGKRIAEEALTLARDLGIYLYSVGKRVYKKIKSVFAKKKSEDQSPPEAANEKRT